MRGNFRIFLDTIRLRTRTQVILLNTAMYVVCYNIVSRSISKQILITIAIRRTVGEYHSEKLSFIMVMGLCITTEGQSAQLSSQILFFTYGVP